MSRRRDDERRRTDAEAATPPAIPEARYDASSVLRDDALVRELAASFAAAFAADDAISWEFKNAADDPAARLFGALRVDVSDLSTAPALDLASLTAVTARPEFEASPGVDLRMSRARRGRSGRRTLVAGAVALTVLSVSGVAAAGIAAGPGTPLYPIHKLILGDEQTASQKAATNVRRFLAIAERALDAGRLTNTKEALLHAQDWLAKVAVADQADLPTRLASLRSRYDAAVAAQGDAQGKAQGKAQGGGKSGAGKDNEHGAGANSGKGSDKGKSDTNGGNDDHGNTGDNNGGNDGTGGQGDDHGTGSDHAGDGSGQQSGDDQSGSSSDPGGNETD